MAGHVIANTADIMQRLAAGRATATDKWGQIAGGTSHGSNATEQHKNQVRDAIRKGIDTSWSQVKAMHELRQSRAATTHANSAATPEPTETATYSTPAPK